MIWLWILASLVLSIIPLINKKIDLVCYAWLLIPIDAYGIHISNSTIKPYIIFGAMIPLILCSKYKGSNYDLSAKKGQLLAGIISILVLAHSIIFNNIASVKGSVLLVMVYVASQLTASCTSYASAKNLSDVLIASCFGCGIIYLIANILFVSGFDIAGIVARAREEQGVILQMRNMVNGNLTLSYRMRGFAFDPNAMFLQFCFGISACITKTLSKFNLYHAVTLIISVTCILLSDSRMGLICCIATIMVTVIWCIKQSDSPRKKLFGISTIALTLTSVAIVFTTQWGQAKFSKLIAGYTNRSGLMDKYGRFTIWIDSLRIFWNNNPFIGVGLGRMREYSATDRMTHNNWLQLVCECGLVVGGLAVIYFCGVLIYSFTKLKTKPKNDPVSNTYFCVLVGYTITILSLISVDNYTCNYLWFGALLLLQLAPYSEHNLKIKTQIH